MTPQAFGEKLRREREKKHITLDQLAARTKVAASLLRSLEAGECARWPGGIYSRGFVRAYAEGTGMDPEQTVAMFVECYPIYAPASDPVQESPVDEGPQTPLEKLKAVLVARYVEARDARDGQRLEALFTADADQLVTTGEWRKGRDNVVKGGLASSQANPGARQIAIEVVRFVAPHVALADGRYEIAGEGGAAARKMRTTFVVTREGPSSEWRIAAIRNMAPTDPAR